MPCWVYVLQGSDGRFYTGITKRLRGRIAEHDIDSKRAGPHTLVYRERHKDHESARAREKYLKSGIGREWLRRDLASQARCPSGDSWNDCVSGHDPVHRV